MKTYDIAIIGAGIAGASLAATLAPGKRILLLDAEDHPGMHATGRSAAFWSETYGGPAIQPLTSASRAFLAGPPAGFADRGFLTPRGALHIGTLADRAAADAMLAEFANTSVLLDYAAADAVEHWLPGRRPGWDVALWEPGCCDIDVGALHARYLAHARRRGVELCCRARVRALRWVSGAWEIGTSAAGSFRAGLLVNAAGAWASRMAELAGALPIPIQPFRRTMVQLVIEPPAPADLPLIVALDGSFYFKPEAGGRLWLSPHDEIPSEPCDAAPEEIDVAIAIDRLQRIVAGRIDRVERKWAGLRSFAPDRLPVIGHDPHNPAFFWLAGQGGFGIQTAPAVAEIAAACIEARAPLFSGINSALYLPRRFA